MIWPIDRFKKTITICALMTISCSEMPEKPNGDLCTIDLPRSQLICSPIPKNDTDPPGKSFKTPIANADKYIAFSPETWKNISAYIQQLKILAEQKKTQLKEMGIETD